MTFLFLMFLWTVCAFVGSAIATGKGRSVVLALCICLFLGPLGVLLLFALPADTVELEARALLAGTVRLCSSCGETVRIHIRMCRVCKEPLDPQDALDHPERIRALAAQQVKRTFFFGSALLLAVLFAVLANTC